MTKPTPNPDPRADLVGNVARIREDRKAERIEYADAQAAEVVALIDYAHALAAHLPEGFRGCAVMDGDGRPYSAQILAPAGWHIRLEFDSYRARKRLEVRAGVPGVGTIEAERRARVTWPSMTVDPARPLEHIARAIVKKIMPEAGAASFKVAEQVEEMKAEAAQFAKDCAALAEVVEVHKDPHAEKASFYFDAGGAHFSADLDGYTGKVRISYASATVPAMIAIIRALRALPEVPE